MFVYLDTASVVISCALAGSLPKRNSSSFRQAELLTNAKVLLAMVVELCQPIVLSHVAG
jgi:hypothetical protein